MKQFTKKWLTLLLAIVSTVCLALGLAACDPADNGNNGGNGDNKITLSAPVITLTDNVISWDAVKDATRYIVYEGESENGTNVSTTSYTINKTEPGEYVYTVAAYNQNADPKIGPKSNPVTYKVDDKGDKPGPGPGPDVKTKLNAPAVTMEGNALNWHPDNDAVAYEIYKNGEKVDTLESFNYLFEDYLLTTYTVTDAENGDKFTVVAVSGDEDVDNSNPSEEVEFVDIGNTLSHTASVYATDSTTVLNVTVTSSGALHKVVIKPNNNFTLSTGVTGVDTIKVWGNTADYEHPTEAVYDVDLGAYVASILINSDKKLYLDIKTVFEDVTYGFTVSLADPYETEDDGSYNVVKTYTLGATGSVDVVLPYYQADGATYWIKIVFSEDVPASGNVLYLTLKSGSTSARIWYRASGVTSDKFLTPSDLGYYQTSDFAKSGNLYLHADLIDAEASISLEVPQAYLDSIPKLGVGVDGALIGADVIGTVNVGSVAPATPTLFNISDVPNSNYLLVIKAFDGITFKVNFDKGAYKTISTSATADGKALGGVYSLEVSLNDNSLLGIYAAGERDGVSGISIYLFEDTVREYSLSADKATEGALIGESLSNAAVFNLVGVEDGKYTLTVTSDWVDKMTFTAKVGEKDYPLTYASGKNTAEIEISGESSISIYNNKGLYLSDVSLTVVVEAPKPKLGHGKDNAAEITLYGDNNYKASVTFELVDVDPGEYTVGLVYDTYEDYRNVNVKAGSNTVVLCTGSGYQGDQKITIAADCTTLTLSADGIGNPAGVKYTLYLLAPGESFGGGSGDEGTGGTETSATKSVDGEAYSNTAIDVSELQYGVYSIKLEGVPSELGDYGYYYAKNNLDATEETTLNQGNSWTGSITINSGKIYLWASMNGTVTVKLERTGDLPAAEGTETSAELQVMASWISWVEVDVSKLKHGEYTVTLDLSNAESGYYALGTSSSGDGEVAFNGTTAKFTINSGKIYLFTSSFGGMVTLKFTLSDGGSTGGDSGENSDEGKLVVGGSITVSVKKNYDSVFVPAGSNVENGKTYKLVITSSVAIQVYYGSKSSEKLTFSSSAGWQKEITITDYIMEKGFEVLTSVTTGGPYSVTIKLQAV